MKYILATIKYIAAFAVLIVLSVLLAIYNVTHDSNPADAALITGFQVGIVMFIIGRLFKRSKRDAVSTDTKAL